MYVRIIALYGCKARNMVQPALERWYPKLEGVYRKCYADSVYQYQLDCATAHLTGT